MLLRAYRLTDKLSLSALKIVALLSHLMADGLLLLLGGTGEQKRGLLGVLALIFGFFKRIFGLILGLVVMLLGGLFRIGRGTAVVAATGAAKVGGGATRGIARRATASGSDAAAPVVVEDPLLKQNRVLSGLFVVTLLALIGVVLWTTRPQQVTPPPLTNLSLDANPTADVGVSIALATPIPTATNLPNVLQARGTIAFTVRQNGQSDLWAVGVGDSRNPIRITNDLADERSAAWSPDGRRLAYASNKDGNWELYIYDLVTLSTERMTYDLAFQGAPTWSPDGAWLAYESYQGGKLDIYVLAIDGSQPPAPLPASADLAYFSPAWSPDGRNIAFTSWRDGASQDIYVFSLDTSEVINLTNTPDRDEDFAAWFPDPDSANAGMIAYSAIDGGVEKIFVKSLDNVDVPAVAIGLGRAPAWSPDGASLIAAVDSSDATHLTVYPFDGAGLPLVINAPMYATSPAWTRQPLPAALVNSGGLPDNSRSLYVEQEARANVPPYYRPNTIINVDVPLPYLNDRVNDSFNALRERVLSLTGWDFLGRLDEALWELDYRPQPGEEYPNWHMAGRAFSVNRAYPLVGFPPQVQIVRETDGLRTRWRLFVRVVDEAQSGQLGEPLRKLPWDFGARSGGNVQAYEQGGRLRAEMPVGYFVDFTQVAQDYGWLPYPAGSDWRANTNTINYWMYYKPDGLVLTEALREIWADSQLGGFLPTPTPQPVTPEPPLELPASDDDPSADDSAEDN